MDGTVIAKTLHCYKSQIDEIYNTPCLKEYVLQKAERNDMPAIHDILFHIHLVEIMENGPDASLVDEAIKTGCITEKNRQSLILVASKMKPHIKGKPTLAKVISFEMNAGF